MASERKGANLPPKGTVVPKDFRVINFVLFDLFSFCEMFISYGRYEVVQHGIRTGTPTNIELITEIKPETRLSKSGQAWPSISEWDGQAPNR